MTFGFQVNFFFSIRSTRMFCDFQSKGSPESPAQKDSSVEPHVMQKHELIKVGTISFSIVGKRQMQPKQPRLVIGVSRTLQASAEQGELLHNLLHTAFVGLFP